MDINQCKQCKYRLVFRDSPGEPDEGLICLHENFESTNGAACFAIKNCPLERETGSERLNNLTFDDDLWEVVRDE